MAEHAMDDATCRRVQAAMDVGVREPTEVLDDDMALRRGRPPRLAYRSAAGDLRVDRRHLDAQREAIGAFFEWEIDGREGVNLLRYEPGGSTSLTPTAPTCPPGRPRRAAWSRSSCFSRARAKRTLPVASAAASSTVSRRTMTAGRDRPKRGMLVAFPADTVHEVSPVIDGHRDTVVDWFS